ncbi:Alanine--tRNA ligase [Frankliniella fusca]|uniref:Alanine--tRNA ligase n=1 Tax=Frankliniella fusca TaxID=407009 RepID=A0AAE1HB75_9NEOP|nr:Alanine--tRNA ligase [Frankliniella fusca]KAK3918179.1 Alanine--tRNA ligase [Frankliniella fusca]
MADIEEELGFSVLSDPDHSLVNMSGISVLSAAESVSSQVVILRPLRQPSLLPVAPQRGRVVSGEAGPSKSKKTRTSHPKVRCSMCEREFSKGYLSEHVKKEHTITPKTAIAVASLPDDEEIVSEVTERTPQVLKKLASSESQFLGDRRTEKLKKIGEAVCVSFESGKESVILLICSIALSICDVFKNRVNIEAPIDLPTECEKGLSAMTSNVMFMESLVEELKKILEEESVDMDNPAGLFFLSTYLTQMCSEILVWMLQQMRKKVTASPAAASPPIVSKNTLPQSMCASVMYAIGSVVRSDQRCRPSDANARLDPSCFTEGGTVASHISNFTSNQNRGGIILVNVEFYRFAKALIIFLKGHAWKKIVSDFSTSHNELLPLILKDRQVLDLWKDIVGEERFASDGSFHSLEFYIRKVTNIFMTGVKNKIINTKLPKSGISVALRPNLAGVSRAAKP